MARDTEVMMHAHLAENDEDVACSLEVFGCRIDRHTQDLGRVGRDVCHAQCIKLDAAEIALFAQTGKGVAHCSRSNCRLGAGIAPVAAMRGTDVQVSLGADRSASNDAGNLVAEMRQAIPLQGAAQGEDAMSALRAMDIAARSGADLRVVPDAAHRGGMSCRSRDLGCGG